METIMLKILHYLQNLKEYHLDTYLHSIRVSILANIIGERVVALSSSELDELVLCAQFHDIGKLKISKTILNKSQNLNTEEWYEIKKHPAYGAVLLRRDMLYLPQNVIEGIYSHHEYFNGKGYPMGLKGEDINIYARIIAVADAIDAMTHKREYVSSVLSLANALNEVVNCKGTQFDPFICEKIMDLEKEFRISLLYIKEIINSQMPGLM